MLVVFPFETDFYAKYEMKAEFVGHPLLDELDPKHLDPVARDFSPCEVWSAARRCLAGADARSRVSEIKNHLEVQIGAARQLLKKYPNLRVALFVAPNFEKEQMQDWLTGLDFPLMLIKDEPSP